jgi:uncharacterized delta-60 repeat protein
MHASQTRFLIALGELLVLASLAAAAEPPSSFVEFVDTQPYVYEDAVAVRLFVRRVGDLSGTVTVEYQTPDEAPTVGVDYTPTNGTLTFDPGETLQHFLVPILNDGRREGVESFQVHLSNPSPGAQLGLSSIAVHIQDNDTGTGFSATGYSINEGADQALITVHRGDDGPGTVTAEYFTGAGTAIPGADYAEQTGTLTFAPGEMTKTFAISILNDELPEPNKTVLLTLRNSTSGAGLGYQKTATLQIMDNELGLRFTDERWSSEVLGIRVGERAGQALVNVSYLGDFTGASTVQYATLDVTAKAFLDYTATAGTLTFQPGETNQSVTVPILDNAVRDGPRVVALELRGLSGPAATMPPATATLIIEDNERPVGMLDASFRPPDSVAGVLAVLPDGRVLTHTAEGLARLNPDGSLDATFNSFGGLTLAADFTDGPRVRAAAVQPDGRIVITGDFAAVGGVPRARVARLNSDGSRDPSFDPRGGPNRSVAAVAIQADGKLIIGGTFGVVDGVARNRLARLNTDGSLDLAFIPGVPIASGNSEISIIAIQADGKIVVAGFTVQLQGGERLSHVVRLNPDGSLDKSFDGQESAQNREPALALLADGRMIVAGVQSQAPVLRLNADGSVDPSFEPADDAIRYGTHTVLGQPDGKVLVAGRLEWRSGGYRSGIVRLHADGMLDPSFDAGTFGFGSSDVLGDYKEGVSSLALQSDGKILIGGGFVEINGIPVRGIARLLPAIPVPVTFEFDPSNYVVSETEPQAKLVIIRRGETSQAAKVEFTAGNGITGQIEFAPLETEKAITIPLNDDPRVEDDEMLTLALHNPAGGSGLYVRGTATLRINDNERPGSLDLGFDAGFINFSKYGGLLAMAMQTDGRVVISGHIHTVNGVRRSGIARLMPDGAVDLAFAPTVGIDGHQLAIQRDGKILAGWGSFTRFNSDGTVDPLYREPFGGPTGGDVLLIQADGRAIRQGGTGVIRCFPDGTIDPSFFLPPDWELWGAVNTLQADDKIIFADSSVERLNSDGSRDASFTPVQLSREESDSDGRLARAVAVQPDGKIVVAGDFDRANGVARRGLVRIHSDGSIDERFDAGLGLTTAEPARYPWVSYETWALAFQTDGKILAGGSFTHANGIPRQGIVRLNVDGSVDSTFDPGSGVSGGAQTVLAIAVQPDGQIVIAGSFNRFNGIPRYQIARLNGDRHLLRLAAGWDPASGRLRLSANAAPGRTYALEVSADLRNWTSVQLKTSNAGTLEFEPVSVPNEGSQFHRVRAD